LRIQVIFCPKEPTYPGSKASYPARLGLCIGEPASAGQEICGRIKSKEAIPGLGVGQLGRTQAFDGVQDASIHGQTVNGEHRRERTVSSAWIHSISLACSIPDQITFR